MLKCKICDNTFTRKPDAPNQVVCQACIDVATNRTRQNLTARLNQPKPPSANSASRSLSPGTTPSTTRSGNPAVRPRLTTERSSNTYSDFVSQARSAPPPGLAQAARQAFETLTPAQRVPGRTFEIRFAGKVYAYKCDGSNMFSRS